MYAFVRAHYAIKTSPRTSASNGNRDWKTVSKQHWYVRATLLHIICLPKLSKSWKSIIFDRLYYNKSYVICLFGIFFFFPHLANDIAHSIAMKWIPLINWEANVKWYSTFAFQSFYILNFCCLCNLTHSFRIINSSMFTSN